MSSSVQNTIDNVRDSIASLFRRRRSSSSISQPQNVRRVVHVAFDPTSGRFSGIPPHWRETFDACAADREADASEDASDDSGVETSPGGSPSSRPKELLRLTFDKDCGEFVEFPPHWRDRLLRNDLLQPEFQKNPHLLASVFAMMDEELRRMDEEGVHLEAELYGGRDAHEAQYAYEIHAHSCLCLTADRAQSCSSLVTVRAVQLP